MKKTEIQMLPGECWYGFVVEDCLSYPLDEKSTYTCLQRSDNHSTNQEAPLLLSTAGRYLYADTPVDLSVKDGVITVDDTMMLSEGHQTLRGAFLHCASTHFSLSHPIPPAVFFRRPQYNTWIELIYNQNQKDVLTYAHGILDHGLPPGILMIDDHWNIYYGNWAFDPIAFPDPRAMVDELHQMGFVVMLWVCPFVSPDSMEYRYLAEKGYLVCGSDKTARVQKWWNGYSAILDMSNPGAQDWMRQKLDRLMQEYGIDGFKFDAGDVKFYRDDDVCYDPNITAAQQCTLWAKFGASYAYNEFRACFGAQGLPLVQRLSDKHHRWQGGVDLLVPGALAQGILGYAYGCPDMIGGGDFEDFRDENMNVDEELFVRYAQCAALMPMMQYSAAPWRVLHGEYAKACLAAGNIHEQHADLFESLAHHAASTGEPIIRYMEYMFPHQGMAHITDQFMVGEELLVAPVYQKGVRTRSVVLPKGKWKYCDGTVYEGGQSVNVPAPLDVLPYFVPQR